MGNNNGYKYSGNIGRVRDIEDCIRATKKYTEGIFTRREAHPIQGDDFPSRRFVKYYEVYPEFVIGGISGVMDMSVNDFLTWVSGETPHYDIVFTYDYRENKAQVEIKDGDIAMKPLYKGIPHLKVLVNRLKNDSEKQP